MRRRLLLILPALLALSAAAARAQGPSWIVDGDWVEPSLVGARNGVAYFNLENRTGVADRLMKATTPAAERAEVHRDEMKNGVMSMRATGPLALAPGERVALAPGGLHLMLIGLKRRLRVGDRIALTLIFEHHAPLTLEVPVQADPPDESGPGRRP
jgi:hypothetical protein